MRVICIDNGPNRFLPDAPLPPLTKWGNTRSFARSRRRMAVASSSLRSSRFGRFAHSQRRASGRLVSRTCGRSLSLMSLSERASESVRG